MKRFLPGALLAFILTSPAGAATPEFDIVCPRLFQAGSFPQFIETLDLNGDGMLDAATADRNSSAVVILFGDTTGAGSFILSASYPVNSGPYGISPGDFNGDGIIDLVSADRDSGTVSVLLGNGTGGVGDGTFAPAVSYYAGGSCYSVAVGDYTGDGIADLAVVNDQGFDDLRILVGNGAGGVGDGTFGAAGSSIPVNAWPHMVIPADFDEDGILDLAVTHAHSESLSVLIGNGLAGTGDGTFASPVNYFAGLGSHSVIARDFDGDGILDLAASIWNTDYIAILLGSGSSGVGDGTFLPMTAYPVAADPRRVVTGDFNGDSVLDLAAPSYDSMSVSILAGVGDGTFLAAGIQDGSGRGFSIAAGDFDGDGSDDLVTLNPAIGGLLLFHGNGDGTVRSALIARTGANSSAGEAADFDGDGKVDLAVCDGGVADVRILTSAGDGTFTVTSTVATPTSSISLATADFNGDLTADVVVTHFFAGTLSVIPGNGDGTLGTPVTTAVGTFPFYVIAGEWNDDGIADLAVAVMTPPSVKILLGNGTGGVGDGTFTEDSSYAVVGSPQRIASGDFNSDGIADLAVALGGVDSVAIFFGAGAPGPATGKFSAAAEYSTGVGVVSLAAADVDGDGILDIVSADGTDITLSILKGNGSAGTGDGTFAPRTILPLAGPPNHVATADLNGDTITDLLVSLGNGGALALLPGAGGGSFEPAVLYGAGRKTVQSIVGDFDGTGRPDVALLQQTTSRTRLLLNRTVSPWTGMDTVDGVPPSQSIRLVNAPNPFNPTTAFSIHLAERSVLRLSIYSPAGRLVRLLALGEYPAGEYRIDWDGRDDDGRQLPSGAYLSRMETNGRILGGKALLLR